MACDLPKLEAVITVPTGGWSITFIDGGGTAALAVPAATYRLTGTGGLLATIVALANDNGTLTRTDYAATCSDDSDTASTGKVTISAGGAFTISTMTADCATALGLAAVAEWNSSVASHESSLGAPSIFLPGCRRGPGLSPDTDAGLPVRDGTQTISNSGTTRTLSYSTRYVDRFVLANLRGDVTWSSLSSAMTSLQAWWLAYASAGVRVDYHADRSVDATYTSWVFTSIGRFPISPVVETWTSGAASLWRFESDALKYVA